MFNVVAAFIVGTIIVMSGFGLMSLELFKHNYRAHQTRFTLSDHQEGTKAAAIGAAAATAEYLEALSANFNKLLQRSVIIRDERTGKISDIQFNNPLFEERRVLVDNYISKLSPYNGSNDINYSIRTMVNDSELMKTIQGQFPDLEIPGHISKNGLPYSYKLGHSSYIPPKFSPKDKKYGHTMLRSNDLELYNSVNDYRFTLIDDMGRVKLSARLLKRLVKDKEVADYMIKHDLDFVIRVLKPNQDSYENRASLDESNMINAIKVVSEVPHVVKDNSKESLAFNRDSVFKTKEMVNYATAQVRVSLEKPNLEEDTCTWSCCKPPCGKEKGLNVEINKIPGSSRHGIKRLADNAIAVINNVSGGYLQIGHKDDGSYDIKIGQVPQGPKKGHIREEFQDTDSSQTLLEKDGIDSQSVSITAFPQKNMRYGKIISGIEINGITIPEGAVITGHRKPWIKDQERLNTRRPDNRKEFDDFRIYDTHGRLLTVISSKDLKKQIHKANKGLKNKEKTFFKDFANFEYTDKGYRDENGVKIYQEFSSSDLFDQYTAEESAQVYNRMMVDMQINSQMEINIGGKKWRKELRNRLYS